MNRIYEDSNYPTFYCWKKEISRNILIGSTEKLKEHLIINNKLLDVPVNEDRFTVLYSIQVQQRALSKEGYEYYLNVQQQNEEMEESLLHNPLKSKETLVVSVSPNEGRSVM